MITRRKFMQFMVIASNGVLFSFVSKTYAKNNVGIIDISMFDIHVPLWLFDKSTKQKDRVKALNIQPNKNDGKLTLKFSGNKILHLNFNTSVAQLIKTNNNRPSRVSMLLKRTIAFSLDAIYNQVKKKGKYSLKQSFDTFQKEETIGFVTIGSLYTLIVDLRNAKAVTSIKWDSNLLIFKVN